MAATATLQPTEERMGQVVISFEVLNNTEFQLAREGRLRFDDVHSVALTDVLMDTGASHLCLPAEIITALGLPLDREVPVETPNGISTMRVFHSARVRFQDRSAEMEAVELRSGAQPLFGALVMEALGVEPDTRRREVRVLPAGEGGRSYIRA